MVLANVRCLIFLISQADFYARSGGRIRVGRICASHVSNLVES